MSQGLELDLKEIVLSNSSFGPREIELLLGAISEDYSNFTTLRDSVMELEMREEHTPASAVRLGVCYYMLGRFQRAAETLSNADGGALALFYLGKCHFALDQFEQAISSYTSAQSAGYDQGQCSLAIAEVQRCSGDAQSAMSTLDQLFGPIEQTAEYLYQRGATVGSLGGNPMEVCTLYERAVEIDGRNTGALFGLAMENDRRGNDDDALQLYQRAAACFPSNVGALLNLGIMFEDRLLYDRAQLCYQRILDTYPNHPQASLYFKDTLSSTGTYYDEAAKRHNDRLAQILSIPVTDFELSVRSRNCLEKMGIRTLGDLARTTEMELLQSKNFGETSLIEIGEMLSSKGLDLGQFATEKASDEPSFESQSMTPDEQAMMDRPISDLNLSVRARKCMARLGLNSMGELLRKSADDLLECKNFGVTSLVEIREKLTEMELKLRGE